MNVLLTPGQSAPADLPLLDSDEGNDPFGKTLGWMLRTKKLRPKKMQGLCHVGTWSLRNPEVKILHLKLI